ncbi:MAG: hypothetical protein OD918_11990 [Gammaproteobacteria bacterium]
MTTIYENEFNTKLAEILRSKNPQWRKGSLALGEAGGAFQGGGRPDILIAPPHAMPIVVETKFLPAVSVEQSARDRLGRTISATNRKIEHALALRAPQSIKNAVATRLEAEICAAKFEYCLFSLGENMQSVIRWPNKGWLRGGVDELVALIENAGISEQLVAKSLDALEMAVSGTAAAMMASTAGNDAQEKIAALLHQSEGKQTMRMAMAITANALTFQELLAGKHDIKKIRQLRLTQNKLSVDAVLNEWERIENEINYHPIFNIARQVVNEIPAAVAADVLGQLAEVVKKLIALGITASHDLYGRMFQRLITDRKFLATFYTRPESAMLLAEIAVNMMNIDFADEKTAPKLRIADFTCGTGTLLSAAYHAVLARHRRAGHDDAQIHKAMMEKSLAATDIMPAGVHLTASLLSSVHPTITFEYTRIHTLPYATKQMNLGALDLLEKQASRDLLQTRTRIGGRGDKRISGDEDLSSMVVLEHDSFDMVIMNPPFTRPTNHEISDRPVPSFAGFSTSDDEQRAMSASLKKINRGLGEHAGNGYAGLASNFIDLAHQKLKAGGIMAMVLPSTFSQGASWAQSRKLVNKHYDDICIISLVSSGVNTTSFSADTGMAEILLLGKKRKKPRADGHAQVRFVSLHKRPANAMQAVVLARTIRNSTNGIHAGGDYLGEVMFDVMSNGGTIGVLESEVVVAARNLQNGILALPGAGEKCAMPVTQLGKIAERGLVHRLISGAHPVTGEFAGPFTIQSKRDPFATYPCLWAHHSDLERNFIVRPDTQGHVRDGMQGEADAVWQTASTLHFNLDFRLNSQSLAACVTQKPSLGGVAWPNVRALNPNHEPAIMLWANSTLGLLLWWWIASRQQSGRARLTISRLPDLPMLDTRKLSDAQHQQAAEIFDHFKTKDFRAANEAYRCESRHALDRALLIDLLGLPETILDPLELLRHKWCNEPSVHGGKKTRPPQNPS